MSFSSHTYTFRPASLFAVLTLVAVAALRVGLFPLPSAAQEAEPEETMAPTSENALLLEDIVVTAQKREQLIQMYRCRSRPSIRAD